MELSALFESQKFILGGILVVSEFCRTSISQSTYIAIIKLNPCEGIPGGGVGLVLSEAHANKATSVKGHVTHSYHSIDERR